MTAAEISALIFEQLTDDPGAGFIEPLNAVAEGCIRAWCDAIAQQIHDASAIAATSWVPQRYTLATRPEAGESSSGKVIRIKDSDLPEETQICLQQSQGAYEWVTLAISSS